MSLINEALKKAQRQRNGEPIETAPAPSETAGAAPEDGHHTPRRGRPPTGNLMVLVGSGAIVLVVLSVVVTVFLLNRPSDSAARNADTPTIASPKTASVGTDSPAPVITPVVTPTVNPPAIDSTPTQVATTSPAPSSSPAPASLPAPTTSGSPAPGTPGAAAALGQDERIAEFVEAIRVAGVRSSGNVSRVLMNERVYRVNDVVDRTLGIKLVKVANDSLVFSDANGVLYEKHF